MTDMIIAVRNKLPEVPRGLFLVGENTGQTIRFDFDDEWSDYSTKTARVCIGNTRTDIDFTGNTVELPLIPSSIRYIDVGVYAGDLCTTAPARIRVIPSILGISAGSGQYDPDSPNVLPTATEVTLDDLFRLNDVSAGRWVKATVRQLLEAAGAAPQPSDDDPAANGEASPGESDEYSRADHVHPTDSALADRISDIENKEGGWNAKWGSGTIAEIPIDALSAETQLEIFAGRQAYDALGSKQNVLTAGDNITIENDVISASGGGASIEPYTDDPNMDGQASAGSSAKYARGDHRHPTDTSRQAVLTFDAKPIQGSTNPVQSGGIYSEIAKRYVKPAAGIPASDLASGVIPTVPDAATSVPANLAASAAVGASVKYAREDHVHKLPSAEDVKALPASTTYVESVNGSSGAVTITVPDELADLSDDAAHRLVTDTEKAAWNAKASVPKYTTLTLAVADWESSGNAYACSKTVAGMTANSIVWLAYSDTETEFTEAQSANTLTFTVSSLPSEAITVNVAFMEGGAL